MRHQRALLAAIVVGTFAGVLALAPAGTRAAVIAGSAPRPTIDKVTGDFAAPRMTVNVVLAPRDTAKLNGLLSTLHDPKSANYRHWLARGQFDALFGPSAAQKASVAAYLRQSGLTIAPGKSPFLLRAVGSSQTVSAAFGTHLRTYRTARGQTYFSNDSAVHVPDALATSVVGVVGLANTVRERSQIELPLKHKAPPVPSCEAPYVTSAQLFAAVNYGTPFAFGYGGGPGCNGLTPSQVNGIYGAPNLGSRAKGAGVTLGLFELSAYQHSDITTWAQTFYGSGYTPPLVDINVDGGPLSPVCPPAPDQCPPSFNGYAGDIEVDADIEMQLAVAPAAKHLIVYNAPNDYYGETSLDEYSQIAEDDIADVVSSSWAVCENDTGAAYAQAENIIFEQMASQGQSMFGAEGDTGAFSCLRSDGTTILNLLDPPAQPWVTSVGGTSLESFNPNANPNPSYPAGVETVWNVDNLCNTSANEGGLPGLEWCDLTGGGGGGGSEYWPRPNYQFGIGVTNPKTTYGNGTTQCILAATGQPCREAPDVSANADEYTPYAEYCTGNAGTPYSDCGTFSQYQTPPGWLGIGGTSLSSPLWSAIIADRDGFQGHRSGNVNPLLYQLNALAGPFYFNDITGFFQSTNNNGYYPTTFGYDEATGIGTPKMSAIITGFPQL